MNQDREQQTAKKVERPRVRDLGYSPGKFSPGSKNSILDVEGKFQHRFEYFESIQIAF